MLWLAIIILFLSLSLLLFASQFVVKSTTHLAHIFHISEFSLGFFILGMATTSPEIVVGISSALAGAPQLSLGNLIGASIVLLTLIAGMSAIVAGEVHFISNFRRSEMGLTSLLIFLPGILILDGTLSRWDGLLLIIFYIAYFRLMNREQTFSEHIKETFSGPHPHISMILLHLFVALIALLIGAKSAVVAAEFIATHMKIPLIVLGLLFLSIGTNLPECAVVFTSIKKKHRQIATGDFLGSAVANTPVLGLVALIHPISLEAPAKVYFSVGILFLSLVIFNLYFIFKKKITRVEGLTLVTFYLLFLGAEVFLNK